MMKRYPVNIVLFLSLSLLAGCIVGKKYSSPQAPENISYRDTIPADTTTLLKWFDLYQDNRSAEFNQGNTRQ
jgi:hypothetical protein